MLTGVLLSPSSFCFLRVAVLWCHFITLTLIRYLGRAVFCERGISRAFPYLFYRQTLPLPLHCNDLYPSVTYVNCIAQVSLNIALICTHWWKSVRILTGFFAGYYMITQGSWASPGGHSRLRPACADMMYAVQTCIFVRIAMPRLILQTAPCSRCIVTSWW